MTFNKFQRPTNIAYSQWRGIKELETLYSSVKFILVYIDVLRIPPMVLCVNDNKNDSNA